MTLIEVLIAAAILAIIVPTIFVYYRQQASSTRTLQSVTVMDQLESELKVFIAQQMTSFLYCSRRTHPLASCPRPIRGTDIPAGTPTMPVGTLGCSTDALSFLQYWGGTTGITLASGAVARIVTSDSLIPAPDTVTGDGSNYAAMRLRCVNNFSFRPEALNPSTTFDYRNVGGDGYYFCLNVNTETYRDTGGARSMSGMSPVIVELRYARFELGTMAPLTCNALPGTGDVVRQATILYYSFYWRTTEPGRGAVYHSRNGSYLASGVQL